MSWPITLRAEAADDLLSASHWYNEQRRGLGTEFGDQVDRAFEMISENAFLHPVKRNGVRSCRLRGFPYVIYYHVLADRVEVIAVLHGSRDPAVWRSRS